MSPAPRGLRSDQRLHIDIEIEIVSSGSEGSDNEVEDLAEAAKLPAYLQQRIRIQQSFSLGRQRRHKTTKLRPHKIPDPVSKQSVRRGIHQPDSPLKDTLSSSVQL